MILQPAIAHDIVDVTMYTVVILIVSMHKAQGNKGLERSIELMCKEGR